VQKAAKILELSQLLQRKPRELSGGQRQRVAMGRAIVRQPAVYLFDEPLSNLDAKLRAQTRLEIQKLHAELGVTSLFVTHDQVEAMTLAQRMIVMNAGRMEQIGTPDEVYHRPATTFVAGFIGSPPMNLLEGQADGSRFTVGGVTLALPAPAPRPGPLLLGVRPEHADGAATGWTMKVDVVEMLGAERLVYCRLGDSPFTVRLDATLPVPANGSTFTAAVEPRHLHWFDPKTQQRVA
jgi:sn-glycerol 3-phosphate transport system ATP-binding protein